MLRDCRHSFDLATSARITDADVAPLADQVRVTGDDDYEASTGSATTSPR